MCTHIKYFATSLQGATKNYQVRIGGTKSALYRDNVCANRESIKPWNFHKCLMAFYRGWNVVVHPCSNFSLRYQIVPLRSIKFKTADFTIFCARIIVIFWTACIGREIFAVVVMGNGKHVLPVLHCLKRGIAFVSSVSGLFIYLFMFVTLVA